MTDEGLGRVAPGDCSPGAPADPYLHFRAYGSSYMSTLRDGSLSESALRLVPDAATVVVSWARFRVSMHPPCFPPTVREVASPVGWGTGARTLGSGGNSTHFKVGLSPAHMATFPAAPPKIPYGGFSPVRLQVPGTAQFSREASHVGRWLKCDPHIRHLPAQLALAFGIASAGRDPTSMCGTSASDDSTWTQRSSLR